ncbi:esterase [Halobacteriales archaeon QS_3_64_16]|nr:MAG: esterase [Halobacteriales archaeon QS_3_64_16]
MSNDRGRTDGEESEETGTEAGERSGLRERLRSRRRFLAGTAGVSGLALGGSAFASGGGTEAGDAGEGNDGDEDGEGDSGEENGESEDEEVEYAWKPTAYDITSADGLRLRVWKEVQGTPAEAVLFVHGATYGGVSMFDPPVNAEWDGWMDYAANADQAAYAVDIRGYGDSERPPEFEKDPEESDPVVPAAVAARDVRDTIEWIRAEQGYDRVHLVGLSSGTWRVRALFAEYDPEVASVTLAAGSYQQFETPTEDLPAWSTQEKSEFVERWRAQVPDGADPDDWIGGEQYTAEAVIDAVWKAIYLSGQGLDSEEGSDDEQTILNPTNLLQDALHDPSAITAPTLVIRGSSDPLISREGALALYDALDIEEYRKEYTEIAGGTHFLFLEDRRLALYDAVRGFQRR